MVVVVLLLPRTPGSLSGRAAGDDSVNAGRSSGDGGSSGAGVCFPAESTTVVAKKGEVSVPVCQGGGEARWIPRSTIEY